MSTPSRWFDRTDIRPHVISFHAGSPVNLTRSQGPDVGEGKLYTVSRLIMPHGIGL